VLVTQKGKTKQGSYRIPGAQKPESAAVTKLESLYNNPDAGRLTPTLT
jgi:hypothetical protein